MPASKLLFLVIYRLLSKEVYRIFSLNIKKHMQLILTIIIKEKLYKFFIVLLLKIDSFKTQYSALFNQFECNLKRTDMCYSHFPLLETAYDKLENII